MRNTSLVKINEISGVIFCSVDYNYQKHQMIKPTVINLQNFLNVFKDHVDYKGV